MTIYSIVAGKDWPRNEALPRCAVVLVQTRSQCRLLRQVGSCQAGSCQADFEMKSLPKTAPGPAWCPVPRSRSDGSVRARLCSEGGRSGFPSA